MRLLGFKVSSALVLVVVLVVLGLLMTAGGCVREGIDDDDCKKPKSIKIRHGSTAGHVEDEIIHALQGCCPGRRWMKFQTKTRDLLNKIGDEGGTVRLKHQLGGSTCVKGKRCECKVDEVSSGDDGSWNFTYHSGSVS